MQRDRSVHLRFVMRWEIIKSTVTSEMQFDYTSMNTQTEQELVVRHVFVQWCVELIQYSNANFDLIWMCVNGRRRRRRNKPRLNMFSSFVWLSKTRLSASSLMLQRQNEILSRRVARNEWSIAVYKHRLRTETLHDVYVRTISRRHYITERTPSVECCGTPTT